MDAGQADVATRALRERFEAQRTAFRKKDPGYRERVEALRSLEQALLRHKDEIIEAIGTDFGGRPAEETLTLELFPVLNEIRHARRHLKRWMAPQRAPVSWQFWPGRAKVLYQPVGVVGIIAPWNYPVFLALAPLAGALAAGNRAMLKPSELAPATAKLLASLLAECFPPEYVTVVEGEADTAAEFARLPFDHLLFTGSTRVGKLVMEAASHNLTPVTLELVGKSPAIVHRSFPTREAAAKIMGGKLYNSGQTCVAPDYVLLPRERVDEFVAEARAAAARLYPAIVANRDYTRIAAARHYQRLVELVDDARSLGAQVIEVNPAGEACNAANRVFPPTLLAGVDDRMRVMQEEIFGPVLPIIPYGELEEALALVNARPHPLALYYFDHHGGRVRRVLRDTRAGGVTVNDCIFHVGQANLPFGGLGPSGMGEYHGFHGFERFSKKKGVFFQARVTPLALLRPPYGRPARWILRFLVGA